MAKREKQSVQTIVAYLGPEATFTHQAALASFGNTCRTMACPSIGKVIASVEKRMACYGIVPVENSTDGAVSATLDALAQTHLKIISQTFLKISQNLISKGSLKTIKKIYSKDVAFGQCRAWLHKYLPEVELVAVDSTAQAVKLVAKDKHAAAIASELAAKLYGVPVVARNIQDDPKNVTRFLILGHGCLPPLKSRKYKSSYIVALKDKPGTLLKVLEPLAKYKINMTKLESRPNKTKAWEYLFYLDIEGHEETPKVQKALGEAARHCSQIKYLGSYPA